MKSSFLRFDLFCNFCMVLLFALFLGAAFAQVVGTFRFFFFLFCFVAVIDHPFILDL
jgi:hypothetical protein